MVAAGPHDVTALLNVLLEPENMLEMNDDEKPSGRSVSVTVAGIQTD